MPHHRDCRIYMCPKIFPFVNLLRVQARRQTFPKVTGGSHDAGTKLISSLRNLPLKSVEKINSFIQWLRPRYVRLVVKSYDSNYDSPARSQSHTSIGQQSSESLILPDCSPQVIFSQPSEQIHRSLHQRHLLSQLLQLSQKAQEPFSQKTQHLPLI